MATATKSKAHDVGAVKNGSKTPREHWGTRRRIADLLDHIDEENIDELIDRVTKRGGGPKIIAGFHPQASWLWKQWHGTVLQQTWRPAIGMMAVALLFVLCMEHCRTWPLLAVPDGDNSMIMQIKGLNKMWGYLLTMTTFVNSFFLSQAYGFWLATKGNIRKVQGRLNDIGILLATHAKRDESAQYLPESRELLQEVARWVRLFHILYWASQVRPAVGDEITSISVLRTEPGLARLRERGLITKREHKLLLSGALTETTRYVVVLEWIISRFTQARAKGMLDGGAGFESLILEKSLLLRSTCASVTDDIAARMPLAYIHLVQILVDALVILAPIALFSSLGVFIIPLVGLLTTFYRGFTVLSKSFLDPFGNEDSLSENFNIFCLLCETNAGSVRWYSALEQLPYDSLSLGASEEGSDSQE